MSNYDSEKLQETLLDLMRSHEREQQLREENAAILAGISAMAGANTKRQVFNSLLTVLRKYIGFEHALVLTREDETTPLQELVTTCPFFESSIWPVGNTFIRALNGESIALFEPKDVAEFQNLPAMMLHHCRSVLLTGVKVSSGDAILLFLHSERGQFDPRSRRVLDRFRPLLERAIIDIDYRERLQSLVSVRTQELIHSQQRFKDFAKTVGDWFWEIDTDYQFTYISAPHLANHMIDSGNMLEAFGDSCSVSKILKTKIEQQKSFEEIEWQLPEREGGIWISLSGTPYFDKHGNLLGYRGTAKDITHRKNWIRQLQEAREQAESANKAKSQFLAMMSHEIRTPLNAVLGFMDSLADSGLDSQQAYLVNQMDQSAQLLLTIINDILDLSRIESGSFELFNTDMDIADSVNLVANQLREQAVRKKIDLQVQLSSDLPRTIVGDKNRISQVMFNLIGNAIKFTNRGLVSIQVTRQQQNIVIAVTDTGIGIADEAQKNLFNPFIQADGSITRQYGGTGLGLAISQHLIEKMNGKITLRSRLNEGSCFTVYIPMIEQAECSVSAQPVIPPEPGKSLNILLAEDSHTNQLVARMMLEKRGHHVEIANHGREAVEKLEQRHEEFDLVFMDISMPVLDGIEATKQLRKQQIDLPIIALTANAMHSDQVQYQQAGMDGFLAKPINKAELDATLRKYQSETETL
ncbi:PAS domain-containing hybrid sensor histidine kinase/response regulator [Photobacterium sp. TY1-4]|uniref:PAS domain-containing hybrid sensor histidine kinase/response regulator n=1 Tax=Photobacterium sp. TY1-4 TaxID=2899122 RepID=UPI0021BEF004|nr:PAS domain-containing hybrid sensor histidine kinase/response regulator [Photobacterium sp. TY1-4]UXI02741.1 ATP-binding protein [Photobacterium sp. TY1-4]